MDKQDSVLPPIVDVKGTAAYLGFKVSGLRRMIREGRGPVYFRAGRLIRFRREDISRWIASRLVETADEDLSESER